MIQLIWIQLICLTKATIMQKAKAEVIPVHKASSSLQHSIDDWPGFVFV